MDFSFLQHNYVNMVTGFFSIYGFCFFFFFLVGEGIYIEPLYNGVFDFLSALTPLNEEDIFSPGSLSVLRYLP